MSYVGFLKSQKKKTLVVLDLNGILVLRLHQNKIPQDLQKEVLDSSKKVRGNFHIWRRPHLDFFLEFLFQHFDVAVWTSAMTHNMNYILDVVFENLPHLRKHLIFEWGQEQCKAIPVPSMKKSTDNTTKSWEEKLFLKTLSKVCEEFPVYTERNVLFLDDTPDKMAENPIHSFYIPSSFSLKSLTEKDEAFSENGEITCLLKKVFQRHSVATVADCF